MEYKRDAKFSFWRRLGGFGQKKKEPLSTLRENYSSRTLSSTPDRNISSSLRRSVSRERDLPHLSTSKPTTSGTNLNYTRRSVSRDRDLPQTYSTKTTSSDGVLGYSRRRSISRDREISQPITTKNASDVNLNYSSRRSVSRERELPPTSPLRRTPSDVSLNYSTRRSVSRERELPSQSISRQTSSEQNINYTPRRSISRERELPSQSISKSTPDPNLNYSLRRSISRERELPTSSISRQTSIDRDIYSRTSGKSEELSRDSKYDRDLGKFRSSSVDRGSSTTNIRPQDDYRRYSYTAPTIPERSQGEGSYPRADTSLRSTSYSNKESSSGYTRRTDNASSDLSQSYSRTSRSDPRRSSLQFYYDPGKYDALKSGRDFTGVRSIYTRNLSSDSISGSGRRAPSDSTYRPLVYTPGSPSPLRRSWSAGSDSKSNPNTMASFMAIGRNSVFPDFLTSRSSQHGQATQAYQDSHESGLEGFKQKTLRLFGNNNNSQKSSSSRSYTSSSPVSSSNKSSPQSSSQSKGTSNGNGGSRNIYRQPSSINNRNGSSRNQSADLRRKYFSQRMMWYSEADEDHIDPDFGKNIEKKHHSALELGSVSSTDLLRSDSVQSSSTPSKDSTNKEQSLNAPKPRQSVLKSASFDYYDNLDYRDSRSLRERSPSSAKGRRFSGSGGFFPKLMKHPSLQRQRSKQQQTRFSDDVAVVYYDQEEKATAVSGSDIVCEQQKLKDDKTSSSTLTETTTRLACTLHPGQMCGHNTLARILANTAEQNQELQNEKNDNETTTSDKITNLAVNDQIDLEGNKIRKSIFTNKSFNIVENDGSHELKLVVPIGSEFIRNRTSVKATSGGKRLIVIAYRNEGEGDLAHVHQYIEKMTLPHPIDAYNVRATMDREGNLKISAPMSISTDQTTTTNKTSEDRQTSTQ